MRLSSPCTDIKTMQQVHKFNVWVRYYGEEKRHIVGEITDDKAVKLASTMITEATIYGVRHKMSFVIVLSFGGSMCLRCSILLRHRASCFQNMHAIFTPEMTGLGLAAFTAANRSGCRLCTTLLLHDSDMCFYGSAL